MALHVERQNGMLANIGIIIQAAGASLLVKDGGKHFSTLLNQLVEKA